MEVMTPYLPHPIDVRGHGPYHVEHRGCSLMLCDDLGYNRVCFEPGAGLTTLRDDLPENHRLCEDIAAFLNHK